MSKIRLHSSQVKPIADGRKYRTLGGSRKSGVKVKVETAATRFKSKLEQKLHNRASQSPPLNASQEVTEFQRTTSTLLQKSRSAGKMMNRGILLAPRTSVLMMVTLRQKSPMDFRIGT